MQLRGMDTNLVVSLHALLAHANVTRAAKAMGLSQSSMSHALARLRAHFDDPLLVPAGRKLVLTERARALVAPVNAAVAQLEAVFDSPPPFDPRTSERTFRIAATDNLELYVLPHLARVFASEAPRIDLRVTALPPDWARALQHGDIDLKLGRKSAVGESLTSEDLSEERLASVVRADHPVSARPTLAELAALDHLVVTPSALPSTPAMGVGAAVLARHQLTRRVALTVPHFLVAPFVVAASEMVLTAPARLVEPFVALLGLRRLVLPVKLARYTRSQGWAQRCADDPGHRWLRARIAEVFSASDAREASRAAASARRRRAW